MIRFKDVDSTNLFHIDAWILYHRPSIKSKESGINNIGHKTNCQHHKTMKYRWQINCNEFLYDLQNNCSHVQIFSVAGITRIKAHINMKLPACI
jgi:hypothetical protein